MIRTRIVVGLGLLAVAQIAGCPTIDARTGNQGGGSLISAGAKIAGGELSSLTPDEIQIIADTVGNLNPDFKQEVSDEQAEASVAFLKANGLNTIEDLQSLAEKAEQDPDAVTIPDSVLSLIEAEGL